MKKFVKWIIIIGLLGFIGFNVYKFFFKCEKYVGDFDRSFKLNLNDYAVINDEAIVKLLKIEDERCLDKTCLREGQLVLKLLVLNDRHISYVTMGTLDDDGQDLEKLGYSIEIVEATLDSATLKLNVLEDK